MMTSIKHFMRPVIVFPALLVGVVVLTVILSYHDKPKRHYGSFDMCWLRNITDIAHRHGTKYQMGAHTDMPTIVIEHDQRTLDRISAEINHISDPSHPQKVCHLQHIKYHAKHVNPKLTPYIPDDIDYISYAPPSIGEHKAVYCYYDFTPKQAQSKCYFIKLDEAHQIVTTDDISDIQNYHVAQIQRQYFRHDTHTHHSYVYDWYKHKHLVYGMAFFTKSDYNRIGYGGIY